MNRGASLAIQTPEGIVFHLDLAGPVTRFLAVCIDAGLVIVLTTLINTLLIAVRILSWDIATAMMFLSYFIISIGYPIFTEWGWRGQTVGKRVLQLRVIDAQGLRLQFSQIVIRNLLRAVDFLPLFYLLGGIVSFLNRRMQRLGDIAANTLVVRNPKISQPDLSQVLAGKYNSFREFPHLAARLRQRVSLSEAALAVQALLRRDQLESSARFELFQQMAEHMKTLVPFPQEATDGLTDEQYMRNVVDILFH
jgi:uncharacterized RDD family membrane protein YckC